MNEDQIREYLKQAYKAALGSPDPSNQNAALLLAHEGFLVWKAFNNFPPGAILPDDVLTNREQKLFYIEHAERAVIYAAFKNPSPLSSPKVMVCPWHSCDSCARAIILSGIRKVIGHKQRMDTTPDRWKASVEAGHKML